MGIVEQDLDHLECFIGPPIQVSFAEYYGFNVLETKLAVDLYRERYSKAGKFENKLYAGIPELLKTLKELQFTLVVATSKLTIFAEQILDYFNIRQYFDWVVGGNIDDTRSTKTEIIQYILTEYSGQEASQFIMVGDREYDIIGANNVGIDSIGVTFGYGSLEELQQSNPTYIIDSVNQIKDAVLGCLLKAAGEM